MIDYPAGLTCTLVQNPLAGLFGRVALASPGKNPFIVGGGRWQVLCAAIMTPPPPCDPEEPGCEGKVEGAGVVARVPGTWSSWRGSSSSSTQTADDFFWVNIAVNVHQRDDLSFYGTLNETIPANQFCFGFPVGESHFTSKPTCLELVDVPAIPPAQPLAFVTSLVTQTSGEDFPAGLTDTVGVDEYVHFGFQDNGNPGQQSIKDTLNGPPNVPTVNDDDDCEPVDATEPLEHGNISTHTAR